MQENNFFSKKGIGFDEYNSQLTLEAQQLADQLYEKKSDPITFILLQFLLEILLKIIFSNSKSLKERKALLFLIYMPFQPLKNICFYG